MGSRNGRGRFVGITIRDVAEASGVSSATVSRAVRGLPNVDKRTRARVQRVAADLDYVISPSASRLASGRT
ncbi:MAG: LacI family DNA-binding transcriptional regulator, partial [Actinomycetia bacterium]|nr:LacI family DNA-binding transcriptional regulator [Actinomycetes bacterium]